MRETEEAASLHSRERGLLWHPYGALADGSHFAVSGASGPASTSSTGTGRR
ncbi:hypothetical protein K4X33_08540 [Brevibacterium casei]|nr:hypothetical protein K4X33_08540 [Brevibacterium casei]